MISWWGLWDHKSYFFDLHVCVRVCGKKHVSFVLSLTAFTLVSFFHSSKLGVEK